MFKNPDKAPKQYTPGEALQKIAAFCAYQERNQKEVTQKLRSYGLDEDEAGEIIIRLSREKLDNLKDLSKATRIRQSEYLREAIADLLEKYDDAFDD